MQSYITFPSPSWKEGEETVSKQQTIRQIFPVETSGKRVASTVSLSLSSPYNSLSALHVGILNSYYSQGKTQQNPAIREHLFLDIFKNYININKKPG